MGIKDKVLDILFDGDEEEGQKRPVTHSTQEKRKYSTNSLLDTGSIFIDATSPLPKEKKRFDPETQNNNNYYEPAQIEDDTNDNDYRLSENISPIFGPLDNKGKVKNKAIAKAKKFNDTTIKNFDNLNKNTTTSYTNIVISPFFGPMPLKPTKKSTKPRKKQNDEFERDIDDTGSFDAILTNEEEQVAPRFEEVEELETPIVEDNEQLMDTDKLARISDRINQIKNQAANIYDDSTDIEEEKEEIITEDITIEQPEYKVETEVHSNISDVIHSLKDHDGDLSQNNSSYQDILPRQEIASEAAKSVVNEEPAYNEPTEQQKEEYVSNNHENINIDIPSEQTSIDDIFDGEDEVEENKDLFSVLFGDD